MSMKKHLLTLALGLLMTTGAFAQVEFVDADKNVIPDGSTVVRNTVEKPVPVLEMYQIPSGISAKNTSASSVANVKIQVNVTDLPFGQLALCFQVLVGLILVILQELIQLISLLKQILRQRDLGPHHHQLQ